LLISTAPIIFFTSTNIGGGYAFGLCVRMSTCRQDIS